MNVNRALKPLVIELIVINRFTIQFQWSQNCEVGEEDICFKWKGGYICTIENEDDFLESYEDLYFQDILSGIKECVNDRSFVQAIRDEMKRFPYEEICYEPLPLLL